MKRLSHLLLLTMLLILASQPARGESFYRHRGTIAEIDDISEGDLTYLSLMDIAAATGCTLKWDPLFLEARLTHDQNELVISMFSSFVSFDDQLLNMTFPALYRRGDLYVPAITFTQALDYLVPTSLFWDEVEKTIWSEERSYNIIDMDFEPKMNGYLIELVLREKLPYEVYVTEQKWININVFGGKLDEKYFRTRSRPRAIKRIRAFQFEESAQLAVKFFRTVGKIHHSFTTNPPRIQISIIDTTFDPAMLDSLDDEHVDRDDGIDVIVIDPGHGGEENGAVGPQELREKDVVLSVATKLRHLLQLDGRVKVIMTRDSDTTLTLQERADIANFEGGDLFISIHANASADYPKASGSQTFFLAAAMNDAARATAMLENRSLLLNDDFQSDGPVDDLDFILFDLLQTEYLVESQELATNIQERLKKKLKIKSRGVDQAGFYVLNKVLMPSVLVELAFISNKREEALLKKDSFQQKAAEAIYEGVKKFIDKYGSDD
jgi:N-acetylmuramoyl-L-alanine amidase